MHIHAHPHVNMYSVTLICAHICKFIHAHDCMNIPVPFHVQIHVSVLMHTDGHTRTYAQLHTHTLTLHKCVPTIVNGKDSIWGMRSCGVPVAGQIEGFLLPCLCRLSGSALKKGGLFHGRELRSKTDSHPS